MLAGGVGGDRPGSTGTPLTEARGLSPPHADHRCFGEPAIPLDKLPRTPDLDQLGFQDAILWPRFKSSLDAYGQLSPEIHSFHPLFLPRCRLLLRSEKTRDTARRRLEPLIRSKQPRKMGVSLGLSRYPSPVTTLLMPSSQPPKGEQYLRALDDARCEGNWSTIPELVRKVRKHAPSRSCTALQAHTTYM